MFIPGETVGFEFFIPFACEEISEVLVTFRQNNKVILTVPITSEDKFERVSEVETRIVVTLSQKESLLFENNSEFKIQLNIFTKRGGSRAASTEMTAKTGKQHYKEVITNGE